MVVFDDSFIIITKISKEVFKKFYDKAKNVNYKKYTKFESNIQLDY